MLELTVNHTFGPEGSVDACSLISTDRLVMTEKQWNVVVDVIHQGLLILFASYLAI